MTIREFLSAFEFSQASLYRVNNSRLNHGMPRLELDDEMPYFLLFDLEFYGFVRLKKVSLPGYFKKNWVRYRAYEGKHGVGFAYHHPNACTSASNKSKSYHKAVIITKA